MVEEEETKAKRSQAEMLLQIAEEVRLFKTPGGESYAQLPVDGRWETHPIRSKALRGWLTLMYGERYWGIPNKTAVENVIGLLEAKARFRSPTQEAHLRLAWYGDALYLDLCNERGEVVRIDADRWNVIADAPVCFKRPSAMLPLPLPERGGSLDDLSHFLNLQTDRGRILITAWLVGTLHPTGPYPVLALHGEKGSAKSTLTRYLRALIDPNVAPAPVQPRESSDLTIKAHHNWIVAFDNMSSMPRWLSDALCRLATGAGDSKRELYADSEQAVFAAKRPCILNGIEELATAGDLLDRAIIVTLPVISEERRTSEEELDAAFEQARPRLLGALLDAVSGAIRNRQQVRLQRKPRMVDFAIWITAAEEALGWKAGTFMEAYAGNRAEATSLEIEASPVARAVRDFMEGKDAWTGSATALLHELRRRVEDGEVHHYTWPKNGQALSGTLTRVAGALRTEGIEVVKTKSGARSITLQRVGSRRQADHQESLDAMDAKIHPFPTFNLKEKEEKREAVGNTRKTSSIPSDDWDDIPF